MPDKTYFIVLVLLSVTACHCRNLLSEADSSVVLGLNQSTTVSSTDDPVVSSTTVQPTTPEPKNVSCDQYNGRCKDCVENKACYYCQSDEKCNVYVAKEIIPTEECNMSDIRYLTCSISFKVLIIVAGVLGGIIFLVILCVCCYCCCKKKGIKLSKDEIKFARQREERKARAEERKKERATRTEEIRRKYGLVKDNPYERFDEK